MVVAGDVLAVRVSTRGLRHAKGERQARLLTNESDLRVQIGQEQVATDGAFRSASPLASTVSGMAIAGASLEAKILSISVGTLSGLAAVRKAYLWGWLEKGRLKAGKLGGDTGDKGIRAEIINLREQSKRTRSLLAVNGLVLPGLACLLACLPASSGQGNRRTCGGQRSGTRQQQQQRRRWRRRRQVPRPMSTHRRGRKSGRLATRD